MAIIHNTTQDNYTQVSNNVLRNKGLSWKARGLLAWLLGCKEGFDVSIHGIVAMGIDGEDAVRSGIEELRCAGYIKTERTKGDDGKFSDYSWTIFDTQQVTSTTGFSSCGETSCGKPDTNKTIVNKNNNNKYDTDFEEWWICCPKKNGKPAAKKAYISRRNEGVEKDVLLNGIKSYASQCLIEKTESHYIKLPQGWLNRDEERWLWDYSSKKTASNQGVSTITALPNRYDRIPPGILKEFMALGASDRELCEANNRWSIYNMYIRNSGCTIAELLQKIKNNLLDNSKQVSQTIQNLSIAK